MTPLWQVSIALPRLAAIVAGEALEAFAVSVSVFEDEEEENRDWSVVAFVDRYPDHALIAAVVERSARVAGAAAPDIDITRCPDIDWLARNRDSFPVRRYGRFVVHGSHDPVPCSVAGFTIQLDPGRAFGSGTHGSTRGCLAALEQLSRRIAPRHILDLGCGSGILSIAAARLWRRASILATDIDVQAVLTARENARINCVSTRLRFQRVDGYPRTPSCGNRGQRLVIANILAEPLTAMVTQSAHWLRGGGHVILSGLLDYQALGVERAYIAHGFLPCCRIRVEGWTTLVFRHPRKGRCAGSTDANCRRTAAR